MADHLTAQEFAFEIGSEFQLAAKTVVFHPSTGGALSITLTFDMKPGKIFQDGPHTFTPTEPVFAAFSKIAGSHLIDGIIPDLKIAINPATDEILLQSGTGIINLKTTGDKRNQGIGFLQTES